MCSKYQVAIYDEVTQELEFSFLIDDLPYPGFTLVHNQHCWEIIKVRLHIREADSLAARRKEPYLVDALVRSTNGLFAIRLVDE